MSNQLSCLKEEMKLIPEKSKDIREYLMYLGYVRHFDEPVTIARAYAIESLFENHKKYIYANDLVAGSIRGKWSCDLMITEADSQHAERVVRSYGFNTFLMNTDHFAPDYETLLTEGIEGILGKIRQSMEKYQNNEEKKTFLKATEISMRAFSTMIGQYGDAALKKCAEIHEQKPNLLKISEICAKIKYKKPDTFHEALQLVWLAHTAFLYEGRLAMALGRMDQYLYPFYKRDIQDGILTKEQALALVECTLYKIGESAYSGRDDVVNIAIGGVKPENGDAVNELSYLILEAVKNCKIPGPNLSARIHCETPDEFLDECLKVVGTGLGYPALMNDEVNIPALYRHGYTIEDCRNYSMVGCIENFITGKQPPWTDGRYNVPKYIELAMNNGRCMLTGVQLGPETGEPSTFTTMDDFLNALKIQMEFGAAEYMMFFRNENDRYNKIAYAQPFLSCFCRDCIERGLDINNGGSIYPSVHGAGCMGIGTFADSLAAVDDVVFNKKLISLQTLKEALLSDFKGYEELQSLLLNAPKYGNNNPAADKYAVLFVTLTNEIFSKYRTRDGGAIYTAIATNVQNIPAGKQVGATPDGRHACAPLSDAASPMHGMDKNGPTSVVNSVTKPDYTMVSCGTVLNQKYSPSMFTDPEKRAKLLAMIKTYFKKGGQEIQINAVSRDILYDAMGNPENYKDLVVRVSGFSAYYTSLDKAVQLDILERTEHE